MCTTRTLCSNDDCKICFDRSFASCEKSEYWNYKLNNNSKPRQYFKGSSKKFWFTCNVCNHNFQQSPNYITSSKRWCPYCGNKNLCDDVNCKKCFDKSFASHEKSKYLDKILNGDINPRKIFKNSNKKYFFKCGICNHVLSKSPDNITSKDNWCAYCVNQKLCDNENCKMCFEKSFANHEKCQYLDKTKTNINPRYVFRSAHIKLPFKCNICNHLFEKSLNSLAVHNSWCPYCCTGEHILCNNNDCQFCFNRSFAKHEKSKYWNYNLNNNISPRNVTISTGMKYWFDCNKCGNVFNTRLCEITTRNTWCNICKNKTEVKLLDWLKSQNYNVTFQKKFDWCKKQFCLPFDYYLEDLNIIIELDGSQHYEDKKCWNSKYLDVQENDKYKSDLALLHNISVIRILQSDVWLDKIDWKSLLKEKIKKYDKPSVMLIGIDEHLSVDKQLNN